VQVKVLLVSGKLIDLLSEDGGVTLLVVFYYWKSSAVGCKDVRQLGFVLLLHELGKITLRTQKDLQLL